VAAPFGTPLAIYQSTRITLHHTWRFSSTLCVPQISYGYFSDRR